MKFGSKCCTEGGQRLVGQEGQEAATSLLPPMVEMVKLQTCSICNKCLHTLALNPGETPPPTPCTFTSAVLQTSSICDKCLHCSSQHLDTPTRKRVHIQFCHDLHPLAPPSTPAMTRVWLAVVLCPRNPPAFFFFLVIWVSSTMTTLLPPPSLRSRSVLSKKSISTPRNPLYMLATSSRRTRLRLPFGGELKTK